MDGVERTRRTATRLMYAAVALFILGYVANRNPDAVATVAPQLVHETLDQWVFWALLGPAAGLALLSTRLWRCPHCGARPGGLNAQHCRACGKPLGAGTVQRTPDGEYVEVAAPPPPSPLDPAEVRRFQRIIQRLRRIDRMRGWRLIPMAIVLGLVAAVVLFLVNGQTNPDMIPLVGIATSFGIWFLLFQILGIVKHAALGALKCPGCDKSLVNQLATFCQHCGVAIPPLDAEPS